jgi:glutathione S-transferase
LYVFTISHYCEKARWALEHKRVDYELVTLLPGPHKLKVPKIAKTSHLPVLVDRGVVIQDSSEIIDHLEQHYPERSLTPLAKADRDEVLYWERRLAAELGDPARRLLYSYAFEQPKFLLPMYLQGGPWWGRLFYALTMPLILRAIKGMYRITPEAVVGDLERMDQLLEQLDARLTQHEFLVGNEFTRADLTLASLAAPLLRPAGHPVNWPGTAELPPALVAKTRSWDQSPTAERVRHWYRTLRTPTPDADGDAVMAAQ